MKTKVKLVKYAFLSAAFLLLAYAGLVVLNKWNQRPDYREGKVTWNILKEQIPPMMQTNDYKMGGQYFSSFERSGVTFSPQTREEHFRNHQIMFHLCVTFVNSLTRDQVDAYNKTGRLYYDSLRPDQKELIMDKNKYAVLASPLSDRYAATDYPGSYGVIRVGSNLDYDTGVWTDKVEKLEWYFVRNGKQFGFIHNSFVLPIVHYNATQPPKGIGR